MNPRVRLNLWIDSLAFAAFVLMSATGLVLRYILLPGSGRIEGEGVGSPHGWRPVSLLWGLTRHEWGGIHFWISAALFFFLSLHIFLHWRWLVCVIQGREREGSAVKFGLGLFGVLGLLALALAPFFSPVEKYSRQEIQEMRTGEDLSPEPAALAEPEELQGARRRRGR